MSTLSQDRLKVTATVPDSSSDMVRPCILYNFGLPFLLYSSSSPYSPSSRLGCCTVGSGYTSSMEED